MISHRPVLNHIEDKQSVQLLSDGASALFPFLRFFVIVANEIRQIDLRQID